MSLLTNPPQARTTVGAWVSRSAIAIGLTIACFAASAQSPTPPNTGANTLKLSVNGMVCAFCAQGIEARLKALPQTSSLYISLKDKIVAVQPKPGQTVPPDKVRSEVLEAGYEVTSMEVVPMTVAAIRQEAKARR